jgi:DNA-binding beta-propeller fold protein YncE
MLGCLAVIGLLGPAPADAAKAPKPAPAAPSLVWPEPPDVPRIGYVRSLETPADLGVKRSALGKFAHWLTGGGHQSERFVKPFGIALDEKANLCFTDTGANAVCYFDQARKLWRRWEQVGKVRFVSPVAVAKQGRALYVADSALGSVVVFDEEGKWLREINAGLRRPSGVAIASNRLFVVDSQLQGVLVFSLQGQPEGQWGRRGAGQGEFNFPTHISAGPGGQLFVTDTLNSRIQVFDLQGRFLRQIGGLGDTPGHFARPKGAAADSFGHIYVLDAQFDNVQLFNPEGRLLMALGQAGNQPGEFWLPNGIAISPDNDIYITDSYNQRIQVFKFIGPP